MKSAEVVPIDPDAVTAAASTQSRQNTSTNLVPCTEEQFNNLEFENVKRFELFDGFVILKSRNLVPGTEEESDASDIESEDQYELRDGFVIPKPMENEEAKSAHSLSQSLGLTLMEQDIRTPNPKKRSNNSIGKTDRHTNHSIVSSPRKLIKKSAMTSRGKALRVQTQVNAEKVIAERERIPRNSTCSATGKTIVEAEGSGRASSSRAGDQS